MPGDMVAEYLPGGGYYTRIFAKVVGPKGRVYMVLPTEAAAKPYKPADTAKALAASRANTKAVEPLCDFDTRAVVAAERVPDPDHDRGHRSTFRSRKCVAHEMHGS